MSGSDAKAKVARLLAPSVESIIARGLNEDFPDGDDRATHFSLNPDTLQAICHMYLPQAIVRLGFEEVDFTDHGFRQNLGFLCNRKDSGDSEDFNWDVTVTQCDSYVNAIKEMRSAMNKHDKFGPMESSELGNYALESANGSILIWVRFTTVVKFELQNHKGGQ